MELTVAITGASGTIYAERTLKLLAESGAVDTINLILSDTAITVAQVELGINLREPNAQKINEWLGLDASLKLIRHWRLDNLAAKPSSGSHRQAGMIIVPCSMATIGAIASGAGTNLIHRAADVCLKEGRKLVVVPRETPYNAIHLKNMLRLTNAGARILPASPGFYHRPQTIDDLVQHLCYRILDQFDIPHSTKTAWTGEV
jgi:4-hydroxy-3-polyprenylbenzoate decarboxylase